MTDLEKFDARRAKGEAHFIKVLDTAKSSVICKTNKELALFHYFNPNGLIAQKRALNDLVNKAVDDGRCKVGAILAYGSMSDDFSRDQLYALTQKRRVGRIDLQVAIQCVERGIRSTQKFLDSLETKTVDVVQNPV